MQVSRPFLLASAVLLFTTVALGADSDTGDHGTAKKPQDTQPPPSVRAVPKLPPGVSATLYAIAVPPQAEPTPEKVALGQLLFNDKRLSADGTVACATCHVPEKGFVDAKPQSDG